MMDFTELPDFIWVKVMAYLSLPDRYKASMTCYKLYTVFSYPGVWKCCNVMLHIHSCKLLPDEGIQYERMRRFKRYVSLIEEFGKHIRHLTLHIKGNLESLTTNEKDFLRLLVSKCSKLEKLHLNIGQWVSNMRRETRSCDIIAIEEILVGLIRHSSSTINELKMDSWPLDKETDHDLPFQCSLININKLSIFHPRVGRDTWIPTGTFVPSSDEIIKIIQPLETLTTLSLSCESISSTLLHELTRTTTHSHQPIHPHFKRFQILIIDKQCPFFKIPSYDWKKLSKILFDITIGTTVLPDLLQIFLSHVSVASLTFSRYARYYPSLLFLLNKADLESFVDYSHGCSELSELVSFVSSSPKLERLVYNGNIRDSTVLQLAMVKSDQWKEFRINMNNVSIDYPTSDVFDVKDDDVLARNSKTGELVQVDFFLRPEKGFYTTDASESFKKLTLDKMEKEVRECIRCPWKPICSKYDDDDDDD